MHERFQFCKKVAWNWILVLLVLNSSCLDFTFARFKKSSDDRPVDGSENYDPEKLLPAASPNQPPSQVSCSTVNLPAFNCQNYSNWHLWKPFTKGGRPPINWPAVFFWPERYLWMLVKWRTLRIGLASSTFSPLCLASNMEKRRRMKVSKAAMESAAGLKSGWTQMMFVCNSQE